jgi:hypothetical protein
MHAFETTLKWMWFTRLAGAAELHFCGIYNCRSSKKRNFSHASVLRAENRRLLVCRSQPASQAPGSSQRPAAVGSGAGRHASAIGTSSCSHGAWRAAAVSHHSAPSARCAAPRGAWAWVHTTAAISAQWRWTWTVRHWMRQGG